MFRLFFLLAFAFFLSSFGASQNKSANQSTGTAAKPNCFVQQAGCSKDGKDGKDGQTGKDGRDGINGRDGRDGIMGPKGEKGDTGMRGLDGKAGIKGEKGEPGPRGKDGNYSAKGEKGSVGEKGSHGEKGQKGMPGTCDKQGSSPSSAKPNCCNSGCSTGFHFLEKVQDLLTRGAADVEHFTINGKLFLAFANYHGDINKYKTGSMIYKMDEQTGKFTLYQTLQTRGAFGLEYFSIADKHFLAVANKYDGTYQLDSAVYQWNGLRFVLFQKIATKAASHFTFFMIKGENYLAVANYYDGSSHSTKSVIYKWSSGKFNKFQEIATEGALGCKAFVIDNDTFIAFADNYNSKQKYSVQSAVFRWSGGHFVKLQSLQTYGAHDVKSFNINGHTFLAFANTYSESKYNTDSFIYKWDGKKFVLFQSIPTRGASAWHPFVISGQTYLGVANYYGDSQKHNTRSVVYQASGAQFIQYQEIPTHGIRDMTSFECKGHTYLAVANYYNKKNNINSALYKWV
ncbi:uncharacterized protein LOC144639061 [Oculina patagonica]